MKLKVITQTKINELVKLGFKIKYNEDNGMPDRLVADNGWGEKVTIALDGDIYGTWATPTTMVCHEDFVMQMLAKLIKENLVVVEEEDE